MPGSSKFAAPVVLVVDDDESIRELVDLILTQAGFSVLRAASADAACEILARTRPAVILLDYNMPNQTGLAVLDWVRDNRIHIPVVMMTASADQQTVWAAMDRGALDYMLKPFQPNALIARVRKAIDAGREAEALRRNFAPSPAKKTG